MRPGLFLVALTAFAAAGFAPLVKDAGLEGSYVLTSQADAQACARACEEDGLCMSWAFAAGDGQCALSAVAPRDAAAPGSITGPSSRAPRFEWTPGPAAAPAESPAQPVRQAAVRGPFEPSDPAAELLGGPDAAPGLRLRFAEDRP
jgi:hypothetical protein